MTPMLQRSLAGLYSPRKLSGAMYPGVPTVRSARGEHGAALLEVAGSDDPPCWLRYCSLLNLAMVSKSINWGVLLLVELSDRVEVD